MAARSSPRNTIGKGTVPSDVRDGDERDVGSPDAQGTGAHGGVHPLLRHRFSPTSFDETHDVSWQDALLLVEAARWAPSAGNSQPWMFQPILRGSPEHEQLVPLLATSSRTWAASASVLVLNLGRRFVAAGSDMAYSEFSDYDLGQAVAHMTIQAQSMGLASRQFRAFDHGRVTHDFCVPEEWQLRTMTAVGRPVAARPLARDRRSLSDVLTAAIRRPPNTSWQ